MAKKLLRLGIGMLASLGYVAERTEVLANLEKLCLPPITEEELLYLLEHYCNPGLEVPSPSEVHVMTGIKNARKPERQER